MRISDLATSRRSAAGRRRRLPTSTEPTSSGRRLRPASRSRPSLRWPALFLLLGAGFAAYMYMHACLVSDSSAATGALGGIPTVTCPRRGGVGARTAGGAPAVPPGSAPSPSDGPFVANSSKGGGGGGGALLSPSPPSQDSGRRFPRYGTAAYADRCGWAMAAANSSLPSPSSPLPPRCAFFVRPADREFEGMTPWIAGIVAGHLLAVQSGCRVLFDYGPEIDLGDLLTTTPISGDDPDPMSDWGVAPKGFVCRPEEGCHALRKLSGRSLRFSADAALRADAVSDGGSEAPALKVALAPVPNYREAYLGYGRNQFRALERALSSDARPRTMPATLNDGPSRGAEAGAVFRVEEGMACSLGRLFRLSSGASQFEPRLFTDLLPMLRDESSLVIAVYVRTGSSDYSGSQLRAGSNTDGMAMTHGGLVNETARCALTVEGRYLDRQPRSAFDRVVWLVVSDNPHVRRHIADSYGRGNHRQPRRAGDIPRIVLSTGSRGKHTRIRNKPSTSDFAEAFIDFYLLGESDVVVANAKNIFTFGLMGGLRTARPIYISNKECSEGKIFR